ncbi:NnrU family protein [Ottowia sp.]|uniref:NnrU family protein n=1 Tax=Ottowia sp. TaxID=1898956 RepID=UPI002BDB4836|nr:NnrU family protein [Ottowia sp.]HRN75563.1 NnrU family protein [Ottowia sp.]HRQ02385.1 NnrU family protein [Ottowia sp.]
MTLLILGLILFLGVHSVRIFADDWRTRQVARLGLMSWKGLYSVVSLLGFALIVWGYGLARQQPVVLWTPPVFTRHLNSLFTLLAFILIVAAYVPRNHLKAGLHHPMVLGVKLWAFGHLLATAKLADLLLFGTFLLWAILSYRAARQRDRVQGTVYPTGTALGTLVTLIVGVLVWAAFAFWLHAAWIGLAPFGRTL